MCGWLRLKTWSNQPHQTGISSPSIDELNSISLKALEVMAQLFPRTLYQCPWTGCRRSAKQLDNWENQMTARRTSVFKCLICSTCQCTTKPNNLSALRQMAKLCSAHPKMTTVLAASLTLALRCAIQMATDAFRQGELIRSGRSE